MHGLLAPGATYQIVGFTPPAPDQMCGWGFEIVLALAFAQRCAATLRPEGTHRTLERRARELVLARAMTSREMHPPVFRWVEGSLLLQGVEVPGVNGCWLNMSEDALALQHAHPDPSDGLSYTTHNVDSMAQAYCLLSCWLHWMRGAASALR